MKKNILNSRFLSLIGMTVPTVLALSPISAQNYDPNYNSKPALFSSSYEKPYTKMQREQNVHCNNQKFLTYTQCMGDFREIQNKEAQARYETRLKSYEEKREKRLKAIAANNQSEENNQLGMTKVSSNSNNSQNNYSQKIKAQRELMQVCDHAPVPAQERCKTAVLMRK